MTPTARRVVTAQRYAGACQAVLTLEHVEADDSSDITAAAEAAEISCILFRRPFTMFTIRKRFQSLCKE